LAMLGVLEPLGYAHRAAGIRDALHRDRLRRVSVPW